MKKHNNNNIQNLFNSEILMQLIFALQDKVRQLEKRIESLEFEQTESDFMSCRENAFCPDDFADSDIEVSSPNAQHNAQYFRLE